MDGGEDKSSIKHGWKKEGGREEEVVIYIYIISFPLYVSGKPLQTAEKKHSCNTGGRAVSG